MNIRDGNPKKLESLEKLLLSSSHCNSSNWRSLWTPFSRSNALNKIREKNSNSESLDNSNSSSLNNSQVSMNVIKNVCLKNNSFSQENGKNYNEIQIIENENKISPSFSKNSEIQNQNEKLDSRSIKFSSNDQFRNSDYSNKSNIILKTFQESLKNAKTIHKSPLIQKDKNKFGLLKLKNDDFRKSLPSSIKKSNFEMTKQEVIKSPKIYTLKNSTNKVINEPSPLLKQIKVQPPHHLNKESQFCLTEKISKYENDLQQMRKMVEQTYECVSTLQSKLPENSSKNTSSKILKSSSNENKENEFNLMKESTRTYKCNNIEETYELSNKKNDCKAETSRGTIIKQINKNKKSGKIFKGLTKIKNHRLHSTDKNNSQKFQEFAKFVDSIDDDSFASIEDIPLIPPNIIEKSCEAIQTDLDKPDQNMLFLINEKLTNQIEENVKTFEELYKTIDQKNNEIIKLDSMMKEKDQEILKLNNRINEMDENFKNVITKLKKFESLELCISQQFKSSVFNNSNANILGQYSDTLLMALSPTSDVSTLTQLKALKELK